MIAYGPGAECVGRVLEVTFRTTTRLYLACQPSTAVWNLKDKNKGSVTNVYGLFSTPQDQGRILRCIFNNTNQGQPSDEAGESRLLTPIQALLQIAAQLLQQKY